MGGRGIWIGVGVTELEFSHLHLVASAACISGLACCVFLLLTLSPFSHWPSFALTHRLLSACSFSDITRDAHPRSVPGQFPSNPSCPSHWLPVIHKLALVTVTTQSPAVTVITRHHQNLLCQLRSLIPVLTPLLPTSNCLRQSFPFFSPVLSPTLQSTHPSIHPPTLPPPSIPRNRTPPRPRTSFIIPFRASTILVSLDSSTRSSPLLLPHFLPFFFGFSAPDPVASFLHPSSLSRIASHHHSPPARANL